MSNPATTVPTSSTIAAASAMLASVAEHANQLRKELLDRPPDQVAAAAVFGAAGAAAVNLSAPNIASLTAACRTGRLPPRKGA